MPKYLTIGYGDQIGYDRTAPALRDAAHAHDQQLRDRGAIMGIAGSPVQVRNHDGVKVEISKGSFLTAALPLAGFALIEAESLEEAIEIVSKAPCAVAQGVVEVWPLEQAQ
ncbi:transcription initiation protein (plasmid) [Rhizobium acidisoli]|uniref:Transcription initiation protein n=1 Tax=Rhizobium acidisoli TaxID=1538158 RepID=A0AAE6C508_9HYPH|nr:YciI family protein [Rhizobium acidisoli]KPH06207.1 transcription initiation protein [Rhizobium acidisoli]QAS82185.1 transcription initiation protein [Rhizobium acidisoli]